MAKGGGKDRVFDELLSFLGDNIFQIPVRSFMDENSLIFEPTMSSTEALEDHKKIHASYKQLIDTLLENFCKDMGITIEGAMQGISKLNQVPDLRQVFRGLFEQVMACTDFDLFFRVMVKRNIMIQEQVLMMVLAAQGQLPDSLRPQDHQPGGKAPPPGESGGDDRAAVAALMMMMMHPPPQGPIDDDEEGELLNQVIRKSKAEHDDDVQQQRQEEEDFKKTVEMSKAEVGLLQRERTKLDEEFSNLTLNDQKAAPKNQSSKSKMKSTPAPSAASGSSLSLASLPVIPNITSSDAASDWIKKAQAEASSSSSVASSYAAEMAKMTPEELQKRQEFLRQQRDKLLQMKKAERKNQLKKAEEDNPKRPQSAHAARSALARKEPAQATITEEDEKRMAMRKAIADKLRAEVIGNK